MIPLSNQAALQAYQRGDHDLALSLAEAELALDPFAADAMLAVLLVQLRKHNAAACMTMIKRLAGTRSPDWILQAIREDYRTRGIPPLTREMAVKVGFQVRALLPNLNPALDTGFRSAKREYVNIFGTSWVRSFGGNTVFFPLYIGTGPTTLFLTDEAAVVASRKVMENLVRCDLSRPTVMIISSDAYYQATNFLKTRRDVKEYATEHDYEVMDQAAERYRGLLEECKKLATGKLYLVCSTPQRSDIMVQLSRRLNVGLRKVCEDVGVGFLDWWDALADPSTGHLKSELSANAYPGDAHFRIETTGLFIDLLKAEGVISDAVDSAVDYDWSHVFECEINKTERTRIWCEPSISPNNALKSHKVAASHVAGKAADILMAFLLPAPKGPIAVLNVRDGYLPTLVPPQAHSGCLAVTGSAADLETAQVVLDFYGRSDIQLRLMDAALLEDVRSQPFSYVVAEVHPASLEEDERRIEDFLGACGPTADILIGTPDPSRLERLNLGGRKVVTLMPTGNRHIPEAWRDYAVAILR